MTVPSILALIVSALGSALLAGVFFAAALPKLRHSRAFAMTVVDYRVLPVRASLVIARVLPPLELLAVLLLLAGIAVRASALLLVLMLVSFIIAVAINLARGRDLDCGCFGASAKRAARRISPTLLLQDAVLLGVGLIVCLMAPDGLALAPWSLLRLLGSASGPVSGSITIVLLGLAACILATLAVTGMLGSHRRMGSGRLAHTQVRGALAASHAPSADRAP